MFTVTKLEMQKNINKWTISCLVIFLLLLTAINQVGIEKFKVDVKQSEQFVNVQLKLVDGFINYQQYGIAGICRLLLESPIFSLFYNSSTLNDLQANVEITSRYKLFKPEMGKNLFERPTGGNLDFSWFFLMFGSVVISIWSFFACRNKEYIMFLNNFTGVNRIYPGIILGRIILIIISILIVVLAAWVQFLINGIKLTAGEISGLCHFFLTAAVLMTILMAVSSGLGAVKNWKKGAVKAAIFWIIFVFLWPEILNLVFSRKAEVNMKSLEEHQMQKNEHLLVFEKQALKNTGRYETIPEKKEADRKSAEHYWQVVSKVIRKIDLEMIEKTGKLSRDFQFSSIFNPVTFYKSVNNEAGSKGYNSYNKFFRENLAIQRRFLRHVFDKRYYENYTKVEPFLPADQLVVKAEPGLPRFYTAGIILNLFYLVTAIFCGYFGFKRFMFPKPGFPGGYDQVDIDCQYGNIEVVTSDNEDLYDGVVNVLFGFPSGFNGKIMVDKQNIVNNEEKEVVYVPGQSKIPGNFRVEVLFNLAGKMPGISKQDLQQLRQDKKDILKKRFADLDPGERTCILLELCRLKDVKIYVIRDFKPVMYGKSLLKVLDKLRSLKETGALILCLGEIFMTPDKSYNYSYDSKEKKYIDLENYVDSI